MINTTSMKNLIIIIAAFVLIVAITAGYLLVPKGVTAVALSDDSGSITDEISVYLYCDNDLDYSIEPAQFTDRDVAFQIIDTSVAKVDDEGVITGIKTGETTLIIRSVNYKDKVKVKVVPSVRAINGIESQMEMTVGNTAGLLPVPVVASSKVNANSIEVSYKSSDSEIASVDDTGIVTALRPGETNITISAGGFDKTIAVTVK